MTVSLEHTIVLKTDRGNKLTITIKDGKITVIYTGVVVTIEKYDDIDKVIDIIHALARRTHRISRSTITEALMMLSPSSETSRKSRRQEGEKK